jgi:hypothetical protein
MGMSFAKLRGTATTTKLPALAASEAVDALADGPGSATSLRSVLSFRELR